MIPRPNSAGARRRRRFPLAEIKLVIVAIGAAVAAALGCLSGITSQAAFTPMLSWMLGFSVDKARATAMSVTAAIAASCVLSAVVASGNHLPHNPTSVALATSLQLPGAFVSTVLLIFLGATIGALFTVRLVPKPDQIVTRRAFQFVGVCVGIYVVAEANHLGTSSTAHLFHLSGPFISLVIGLATGAATQVLGLASGTLLVPALYYVAPYSPGQAVLISTAVIGLASLLPAYSYARSGRWDGRYAAAGLTGGVLVGIVVGSRLLLVSPRVVLMMFALLAMFFSAREISRIALEQTVSDTPRPGPDLS